MKSRVPRWLGAVCAFLASAAVSNAALAQGVLVVVQGQSGPWDISANPGYSYGVFANGTADSHLPPSVVDASSGLPFSVGDTLRIEYVSGTPLAGGNGSVWGYQADGVPGWAPNVPPCTDAPGCYTGQTTNLEQLLGTFADSAGHIVGTPFALGSQNPTDWVIPVGSTRLLLGFNDGWYNDNGSAITVRVTEVAAVPEPETLALVLAGLGLLPWLVRRKAD